MWLITNYNKIQEIVDFSYNKKCTFWNTLAVPKEALSFGISMLSTNSFMKRNTFE